MRALGGAGAGVRGRHGSRHRRSEPRDALGARADRCPALYRRLAAAGLGAAGRGNDHRRDQLPGRRIVPPGGDAVARTGAADRGQSRDPAGRWCVRRRTCASRSAAARTAAGSITSPRLDSRAASGSSAIGPVPQYFMMLGGGAGQEAASFGRLTAKIPARRVPEAVDRMLRLYEEERTTGETAPAFFLRVDPAHARAARCGSREADGRRRDAGRLHRSG